MVKCKIEKSNKNIKVTVKMPPQSKENENEIYNEHVETKRMNNWKRSMKKWTKRIKKGMEIFWTWNNIAEMPFF